MDAVAGYGVYIDLIRPVIGDKPVIQTPMTQEIQRVSAAIDLVLEGKSCALVSSGDPGVYAMAGLVFELCKERNVRALHEANEAPPDGGAGIRVEVVPGIPALCAGAALLGAPIGHDFAAISLSDLLTPWEVIEQRIEAAARADFVIVFYNPKSKKRDWQLAAAQKIILKHRSPQTPAGVVKKAMRDGQDVRIMPLDQLHTADVDMQSAVFVGNAATFQMGNAMVTPRGYADKYRMDRTGERKDA